MADKWFIIEQFGKVGPFTLQDLLSGVERGDFDYSITIESEHSQQRTTLTELIARKKKARRTKKKKRADVEATRIVPSENRHRSPDIAYSPDDSAKSARSRRASDATYAYVERRSRSSRDNTKLLVMITMMLAGGVLSLALVYGLKLTDVFSKKSDEPNTPHLHDLPLAPEELAAPRNFNQAEDNPRPSIIGIKAARRKTNQTVVVGPLTFSRSDLYRCRVKCKLEFRDKRGDRITGVFFAEAFKNELLKHSRRVIVKGRVSADGNEIYLQNIIR